MDNEYDLASLIRLMSCERISAEEEKRNSKKKRKRRGSSRVFCVVPEQPLVSCTTFNILAPIYKRLNHDQNCRESEFRGYWLSRNQMILDLLLSDCSSIICLQEVWLNNEELVEMYDKRLGDANYQIFKLARTNNRGDGLLTAVNKNNLRVINYKELLFNDFGDRVAQLLHVESNLPFSPNGKNKNISQEILIVNTHLLFPHDKSFCIVRLKQVYKILQYIESYQKENKLGPMPIILSGDWNGSKRGQVYKFLRSQCFVSSYDTAHKYTDNDADCNKWVSHSNHRGNICGVDFIWLLNPNMNRKPLKTSWNQAVLAIIKYLLRATSLSEYNAFELLKGDNNEDYITYYNFCQALSQLNLLNPNGLGTEEIDELWAHADLDKNGVLDFEEFLNCIWNPKWVDQTENTCEDEVQFEKGQLSNKEIALGFNVKNAVLFPPEVEKGTWPDNYNLSDHAPLTVTFSPVRLYT